MRLRVRFRSMACNWEVLKHPTRLFCHKNSAQAV